MRQFIFAALAGATLAYQETQYAFVSYIAEYGKSYSTIEEYRTRLGAFAEMYAFIQSHNSRPDSSVVMGLNHMSDWTRAEREALLVPSEEIEPSDQYDEVFDQVSTIREIDWRTSGKVNAVQDQGSCGSCYIFSAVAATESAWAIDHGRLYKLSEQQGLDCLSTGCGGGNPSQMFNLYKSKYGVIEKNWRYTGISSANNCNSYNSKQKTSVKTQGYHQLSSKNPDSMKQSLQNRVISVAIDCEHNAFYNYQSGIFTSRDISCRANTSNHVTDVVGWGSESGQDYWIMRNSWSSSWGEKGYMRVAIENGAGVCNIQQWPKVPLI